MYSWQSVGRSGLYPSWHVRGSAAHREQTWEGSATFHPCGCRNVPREVKVIPTELLKIKPHLTSSGNLLPLGERTLHQQKKETSSFTILLRVLTHQSWWQIHVWINRWMRRGRTELRGECILTTWWKSEKPNLGILKCVATKEEL